MRKLIADALAGDRFLHWFGALQPPILWVLAGIARGTAVAIHSRMARRPRIFIPGSSHHVIQRGNNRADIFKTPSDYELFLCALCDAATRSKVKVDAYSLMTNHVHLVLTPEAPAGIPTTMQSIGRRYVYHFNRCHGHTGGLFEGRYRDVIVDSDEYWFTCIRYVELNPVRAGLAATPDGYEWTSYRAHALGATDPVVTPHALYLSLGATPESRQQAWRAACDVPIPPAALEILRESVRKGRNATPPSPRRRRSAKP